MENWKCSKCKALNPPRRKKCWQCGISRLDPIPAGLESTQPTRTLKRIGPTRKQQRSEKLNPTVIAAIIGLIGTLFTAIIASPFLIALIQKPPAVTDTPSSTPTTAIGSASPTETPSSILLDLKIEYGGPLGEPAYSPGGVAVVLPARPTAVIPWTEIFNYPIATSLFNNVITMSVTNQSNKMIILSNKIPIEVSRKTSTTLVHIYSPGEVGGLGNYRNFVSRMPADLGQQVIYAEFEEAGVRGYLDEWHMTPMPPINQPDFFTLAPGEIEVFVIEVLFVAPGDYTLRPGIEVGENGKTVRVWAPDIISASLPETEIVWSEDPSTGELVNETCRFNYEANLAEKSFEEWFSSVDWYICEP